VIALQRASGNAAVTAMIARNGPGTATPEATAADALTKDQQWDKAIADKKWDDAIALAADLSEADLVAKLDKLDFDQIKGVVSGSGGGLFGRIWVRLVAEPVRKKKLDALYEAAVNGEKWDKAVVYLDDYREADVLPKARLIKAKGDAKLAAAAAAATATWADDNHRVRRTLSFLAVENLTGSAVRPATASGVTGGTKEAAVDVPETGGKVTFTKDASMGTTGEIYGLTYEGGAESQKTGWIQFIARNIETFDDTGKSIGFHTGQWTPSGQGPRDFSTTTAPKFFLDVLSDQSPFYEAVSAAAGGSQGLSDISATKTAMYDRPSGRVDLVAPKFTDPKVKTVKSRACFDTYLVSEMQVLRHETIQVEYTFTAAQAAAGNDTTPVTTHSGGGRVSSLPADRFKAITAKFPKFAYLPHG
jgi:hypothetical protein